METDALTDKGKSHKGKRKSKADTTKDCRFKNTSKSGADSHEDTKGKGKGKGKGKNSVNKVTTPKELKESKEPKEPKEPIESIVTPTEGTTISVNQISRITQDDDTWDHPLIQNADEEYRTGYVSATIRYRKPP